MGRSWGRAGIFLGLMSIALVAGLTAGTWATAAGYPAQPTPETQASIQSLVQTFFAPDLNPNSDPPTSAEVVLTTRGDAIRAVGGWKDTLDPSTPIYLVELTGDFVGYNEPIPIGAQPPEGKALFVFYDPASERLADYGMGPQPWDLSALGSVSEIPVDFSSPNTSSS